MAFSVLSACLASLGSWRMLDGGYYGTLCVVVALLGIRETKNAVSSTETPLRAELGDEHRNLVSTSRFGDASIPSAPARLSRTFYYILFTVGLFSLGNSSDMFLVLRA